MNEIIAASVFVMLSVNSPGKIEICLQDLDEKAVNPARVELIVLGDSESPYVLKKIGDGCYGTDKYGPIKQGDDVEIKGFKKRPDGLSIEKWFLVKLGTSSQDSLMNPIDLTLTESDLNKEVRVTKPLTDTYTTSAGNCYPEYYVCYDSCGCPIYFLQTTQSECCQPSDSCCTTTFSDIPQGTPFTTTKYPDPPLFYGQLNSGTMIR